MSSFIKTATCGFSVLALLVSSVWAGQINNTTFQDTVFTQAQLDNLHTTPVQVVPGVAPGREIVPLWIEWLVSDGITYSYPDGGGGIRLGHLSDFPFDGAAPPTGPEQELWFSPSAELARRGRPFDTAVLLGTPWITNSEPIYLWMTTPLVGGTRGLKFRLYYLVAPAL